MYLGLLSLLDVLTEILDVGFSEIWCDMMSPCICWSHVFLQAFQNSSRMKVPNNLWKFMNSSLFYFGGIHRCSSPKEHSGTSLCLGIHEFMYKNFLNSRKERGRHVLETKFWGISHWFFYHQTRLIQISTHVLDRCLLAQEYDRPCWKIRPSIDAIACIIHTAGPIITTSVAVQLFSVETSRQCFTTKNHLNSNIHFIYFFGRITCECSWFRIWYISLLLPCISS